METAKFDLHLHSYWSYDASAPVEYFFEQAENLGVTHISITEHHHMDSIDEALEISKRYPSIHFIPGAELTVHTETGSFDMICLGMPVKPTPGLQLVFEKYHKWQREYGEAVCRAFTQAGYPYSTEDRKNLLNRYRPEAAMRVQGITHVQYGVQLDFLVKERNYFADVEEHDAVLEKIWNTLPNYPEADDVLPEVRKAGALIFIAHPKNYFKTNDLHRMDELRERLNFDGIECAHTSIPIELTPFYREYCKRRMLLSSAGSDTHSIPKSAWNFCSKNKFAQQFCDKRYLDEIIERLQ